MAVQIQVLNCPECNMKLAAARKAKQGRFQLELMPDTHFDEIRQTLTCPDCQKAFDVKTQLPPPHLAIVIKGARPTTPILTSDANIHAGSSITRDTGENEKQEQGAKAMSSDPGIAVVRRNTEEVQSRGNFEVFEELFASDFVDHTPQPGGFTPDRDGARNLYRALRAAFPDFHAEIHWQISDGDRVTTYKTYHGTHQGTFQGLAPTGRKVHFETVDVMRVRNGKITEHWGVANLFSLMQQLGVAPSWGDTKAGATS